MQTDVDSNPKLKIAIFKENYMPIRQQLLLLRFTMRHIIFLFQKSCDFYLVNCSGQSDHTLHWQKLMIFV